MSYSSLHGMIIIIPMVRRGRETLRIPISPNRFWVIRKTEIMRFALERRVIDSCRD